MPHPRPSRAVFLRSARSNWAAPPPQYGLGRIGGQVSVAAIVEGSGTRAGEPGACLGAGAAGLSEDGPPGVGPQEWGLSDRGPEELGSLVAGTSRSSAAAG